MIHMVRELTLCGALAALVTPMAVAGVFAAASRTPTPQTSSRSGGRIVVLGDSLAVSPSPVQSFAAELQTRLRDKDAAWTVVNAGVRGDTTTNGLKRFDAAVTPETRILILELGANDGLRGVDVSTVENNLSEMIRRAQAKGIRVVLCGMMTPPQHGWNYTVAFYQLFPRLAMRYTVPLVPFVLEGVALNRDLNGPDGIHPNAAGAKRIAETIWPYLEPLVQREGG